MVPYKNRYIDYSRKGRLYIYTKNTKQLFSFTQDGLVRAHLSEGDTFRVYPDQDKNHNLNNNNKSNDSKSQSFITVQIDKEPKSGLILGQLKFINDKYYYFSTSDFSSIPLSDFLPGISVIIASTGLHLISIKD